MKKSKNFTLNMVLSFMITSSSLFSSDSNYISRHCVENCLETVCCLETFCHIIPTCLYEFMSQCPTRCYKICCHPIEDCCCCIVTSTLSAYTRKKYSSDRFPDENGSIYLIEPSVFVNPGIKAPDSRFNRIAAKYDYTMSSNEVYRVMHKEDTYNIMIALNDPNARVSLKSVKK